MYYYILDSKDKENIKLLEFSHFYLVQCEIRFELNLCDCQNNELCKKSNKVTIFNNYKFNINDLYKLSKQVYKHSRFYNDRNIDKVKVEELYRIWIYNSYYKGFADNIYVYSDNGAIQGFCVIQNVEQNNLRISLIGVDKKQRGNGVTGNILFNIISDYKEKKYKKCLSSTQSSNISALNFYINNCFRFY